MKKLILLSLLISSNSYSDEFTYNDAKSPSATPLTDTMGSERDPRMNRIVPGGEAMVGDRRMRIISTAGPVPVGPVPVAPEPPTAPIAPTVPQPVVQASPGLGSINIIVDEAHRKDKRY